MTDSILKKYPYLCAFIMRLNREIKEHGVSYDQKILHLKKKELQSALEEKNSIEQYIQNVTDLAMREILTCRYLYGEKWEEIASHFGYSETKDSVRMKTYRYLRK